MAVTHYIEIEIDAAKVDEAIPVIPVFGSPGDTTFWNNSQGQDDFVFKSEDGVTTLPHYRVSYTNNSDGTGEFCYLVNVSAVISASVNGVIRLEFGDSSATDTSDGSAVFSGTDIEAFWLPGETLDDITGNGNDLTAFGTPGTVASDFEGVTAATYNGSSQYHTAPPPVTNWPMTMVGHLAITSHAAASVPFSLSDSSAANNRVQLNLSTHPRAQAQAIGTGGPGSTASLINVLSTSTYYQMAVWRTGATGTAGVDVAGVGSATDSTTIGAASFTDCTLAALEDSSLGDYADIELAELEVSSVARSADYRSTREAAWTDAGFLVWGTSQLISTSGDTDFQELTAAADVEVAGGDEPGTNLSNFLTSLATAMTCDIPAGGYSRRFLLDDPDTNLDAVGSNVVTGIAVEVTATGQDSGTGPAERIIYDEELSLIIGGSLAGDDKARPQTPEYQWTDDGGDVTVVYGGEFDTWGLSEGQRAGANFTASDFGVALRYYNDSGSNAALFSGKRVRVKLWWGGVPSVGGTGALTGLVGTMAGSGGQTVGGTGALTGLPGAMSGSGVVGKTGTGALTGLPGAMSGSGVVGKTGTGALTGLPGTMAGSGKQTHSGTGALTGLLGVMAGEGTTGSDRTGTGALVGVKGRMSGTGLTGRAGSGALTGLPGVMAGSGTQTHSGTGALTGLLGVMAGTGINSPPNVAGVGALTGLVGSMAGFGVSVELGAITGDSLVWYLTGASQDGETQRDPGASLGGYRSSQEAELMTWDLPDPMVGIEIVSLSGGNGRGAGSLVAATEGSLSWTPPNGRAGSAVAIANGGEATLFGLNSGAWIRVRRVSEIPLEGSASVLCLDCFNNVIGMDNVPHADAVAGEVYYRAVLGKNESAFAVSMLSLWLGGDTTGDIAIAVETPVSDAIQTIADATTAPTGLTWSTATDKESGLFVAFVQPGEMIGLWVRRTVAADSDPAIDKAVEVAYDFSDTVRYLANALRGRYRIARTDFEMEGVWVGAGADPDLDGAPDETWTSTPHTTSLGLSPGVYHCVRRKRNTYGVWSQNNQVTVLRLNAAGGVDATPPSGPTAVQVTTNADDEAVLTGLYEPGKDGADLRAELFVIWLNGDGTDPDPDVDTPAGYELMDGSASGLDFGLEILNWTDAGNGQLDGTPLSAVVRTRRVVTLDGDGFSPDTTQLPASGSGTIVVATELANWGSSGFLKVADDAGGIQEIVAYDSLVVGSGISTFTVLAGGRGQWGTSAAATTEVSAITEVTYVDSENTEVATHTVDAVAPGRPWGDVLFPGLAKHTQAPVDGPDGVTVEYIDEPNNVYLLLGEGWTELWMDTALVWKCFADANVPGLQALYIPSEWDLVADTVSAAASGSDVFETTGATDLFMVVGGTRRVHIDGSAMTITVEDITILGDLPDAAPQASTWAQYAGSLVMVWDPAREDYRPFLQLTSAGELKSQFDVDNSLAQAAVVAL